MTSTFMNYNESEYQEYYQKTISMLGDIRLERIKFKHNLVTYKGQQAIKIEENRIDANHISSLIFPDNVHEDTNNVITSINNTQQFLSASYSLLRLQLDEINNSKKNEETPEYFWFVFYAEDTLVRISTLNDLLWNFVNYFYEYNLEEKIGLRNKVIQKLKMDKQTNLIKLLDSNLYQTKEIRNHFMHNTKPYLYQGSTTVEGCKIKVGQGDRDFNLDEDIYKIEADIKRLSKKYQDVINELNLETI